VLEAICAKKISQRVAQTWNGVGARLERLTEEPANCLAGEITRIQTTNFPSEVHDEGTKPLRINNPLGHGIAFRYQTETGTLAIQYEPRVLSPSRVFQYLEAAHEGAFYNLDPIVRNDAWNRFDRGPARRISIAIASPSDLDELEGASEAAATAASRLARAYDAPLINIELSMGHRKGNLGERAKTMVRELVGFAAKDEIDLRALRVVPARDSDGNGGDEINLLDDVLNVREELNLPDNDPDTNYAVRKDFLTRVMRQHG